MGVLGKLLFETGVEVIGSFGRIETREMRQRRDGEDAAARREWEHPDPRANHRRPAEIVMFVEVTGPQHYRYTEYHVESGAVAPYNVSAPEGWDPYALFAEFNLNENSTDEEVRSAFRRLAMSLHPDKASGQSDHAERARMMREVSVAYAAISEARDPGRATSTTQEARGCGGNVTSMMPCASHQAQNPASPPRISTIGGNATGIMPRASQQEQNPTSPSRISTTGVDPIRIGSRLLHVKMLDSTPLHYSTFHVPFTCVRFRHNNHRVYGPDRHSRTCQRPHHGGNWLQTREINNRGEAAG